MCPESTKRHVQQPAKLTIGNTGQMGERESKRNNDNEKRGVIVGVADAGLLVSG